MPEGRRDLRAAKVPIFPSALLSYILSDSQNIPLDGI
jgi:hypothetical protein